MNDILSQNEPPEVVAGYGDGEFWAKKQFAQIDTLS
jgi:hypothetical protein